MEIFPQDKQVAGSPTDSSFLALPPKLPSKNMEERVQLVKIRVVAVLESTPNDADKMIHIATGCTPRRDDCRECKINVCFFNAILKF